MTSAIKIDAGLQKQLGDLVSQYSDAQKREVLDHLYESPWTLDDPNGPYPWQVEFHNQGAENVERAILAANQVGKTMAGAAEVAIHLTGHYPDWWEGKRFDHPVDVWVGSETNQLLRDVAQEALFGGVGQEFGTGMIPGRCLKGCKPKMLQCGVANVVESVQVRHATGGKSFLGFKTYQQGYSFWQGPKRHVVWYDEEPDEDVYTEGQTRTINVDGITILTFTPLKGVGRVVSKFLDHTNRRGIYMINVGWDDAPHMDEDRKAQMLDSFPEYQRDARTKGLPMMGEGVVFPFSDDLLKVDPFPIPSYFKRICGIDFGINHPAAAVWLAIDSETGTVYVTDCYKKSGEASAYHAARINANPDSKWIPVSWPHDGMNREKSGGDTLADHYRKHGANMMAVSARRNDDAGGAQPLEATIEEIYGLMKQGQFKVFSHLTEWFKEKNLYHRDKNTKIVPQDDDIMSATRYAVMMMRYAISRVQADRMHNPLTQVEDAGYDPTSGYDY